MKLTYDNEYSLFNSENVFVGGSETTFKINGVEVLDDAVILKCIQVWDEDSGLLPKGTIFELNFKGAKLEDLSVDLELRRYSAIENLEIIAKIDLDENQKALGYNHGIQLFDDAGQTLNLIYDDADVSIGPSA